MNWKGRQKILKRQRVLEDARNPIVWHKSKWRWRDRNVPWNLSYYQWKYGDVAFRRLRSPGSIYERQLINRFLRP